MIWAIVLGCLLAIMALGQLRVHRTEKIRLRCVELATGYRHYSAADYTYIHSEKAENILARAEEFEKYVRGIEPKKEKKPE